MHLLNKTKSFMKIQLIFISLGLVLLNACSKKPDIENTSTVRMSGEWYTRYFQDNDPITEFHLISTYNTSDPNSGMVWVDDESVWPFKAKFAIDYNNLAFSALNSTANTAINGETIKVYEGKVIPGAGRSKTGVAVDSIYLRVEFSDDPGNIYEIRGHQRTGFFEDDY
jgi:hypothetical protein